MIAKLRNLKSFRYHSLSRSLTSLTPLAHLPIKRCISRHRYVFCRRKN